VILRVTAYHRRDYDEQVISFSPFEHAKAQHTIAHDFDSTPTSGRGILEKFPAETFRLICLRLDLVSLLKLRPVNRVMRQTITLMTEYKNLTAHGLDAILAVLRTGLGDYLTLQDLYRPLLQERCTCCGGFGGFIFLLTCTRCCIDCLNNDLHLTATDIGALMFKESHARILRDLSPVHVPLRTLPGAYSRTKAWRDGGRLLVAGEDVWDIIDRVQGPGPSPARLALLYNPNLLFGWQKCAAAVNLPFYDPKADKGYRGFSCKGCVSDITARNWVSPQEQNTRVYSREGFIAHFKRCGRAQRLWLASRAGTREVTYLESPFSMNGGINTVRVPWYCRESVRRLVWMVFSWLAQRTSGHRARRARVRI